MHVSFNDELKRSPVNKINKHVVEYLSSKAPDNTHYCLDENGTLYLTADKGTMLLSGFRMSSLPEEWKEKIGNAPTKDIILRYSYNSQQPIELELEKEGYIIVNGEEIPIQEFIYNPFHTIKIDYGHFYAIPRPFPKANCVIIEGNGNKRHLNVRRIPNNSYCEALWQSDEEKSFTISWLFNEDSGKLKFTFSTNLKCAKSIKEVIESISIFNAFVDGKGLINGELLDYEVYLEKNNRYDDMILDFWRKTYEVEQVIKKAFGLTFIPKEEIIDTSTLYVIEELYQCLIKNKPVLSTEKIYSLNGKIGERNRKDLDNLIGKNIFFEFTSKKTIEIFGVTFQLEAICGIFDAKVKKYEIDGERFSIYFSSKPNIASIDFIGDEQLESYKKKHIKEIPKILQSAISLKELIGIEE